MDTMTDTKDTKNGAALARVQPTTALTTDPRAACAPSSLEQVNRLEEEKAKLIISLQLKTKEKEMLSEEPTLEAHQESQRRRT